MKGSQFAWISKEFKIFTRYEKQKTAMGSLWKWPAERAARNKTSLAI